MRCRRQRRARRDDAFDDAPCLLEFFCAGLFRSEPLRVSIPSLSSTSTCVAAGSGVRAGMMPSTTPSAFWNSFAMVLNFMAFWCLAPISSLVELQCEVLGSAQAAGSGNGHHGSQPGGGMGAPNADRDQSQIQLEVFPD